MRLLPLLALLGFGIAAALLIDGAQRAAAGLGNAYVAAVASILGAR